MTERPRFFDDLAGVAGGAFSAMTGLRDELEGMIRARADEAIRKLDLVKRDELEAVQEMAAAARAGQEAAEVRLAALEAKLMATAAPAEPKSAGPMRPADPAADGTEAPSIALPATGGTDGRIEPPSID